jgi:hypothetical protein
MLTAATMQSFLPRWWISFHSDRESTTCLFWFQSTPTPGIPGSGLPAELDRLYPVNKGESQSAGPASQSTQNWGIMVV